MRFSLVESITPATTRLSSASAILVWTVVIAFVAGTLGLPHAASAEPLPAAGAAVVLDDLQPDSERSFEFAMEGDEALHIVVQQESADIQLELFLGTDSGPVRQINGQPWAWGEEYLFYVSRVSTNLRLVVRSDASRPGRATLRVQRKGPATQREALRHTAENLYLDSRVSRAQRGAKVANAEKVEMARKAATLFGELELPRQQALALNHVGSLLSQLGNPTEALAAIEQGIAVAQAAHDKWAECDVRATRAEVIYDQSVDAALQEELFIVDNFTVAEAAPCLLATQRLLVFDLNQKGEFDRSIALFERALPLTHELDEPWERAGLHLNVGTAHLGRSDFSRALESFATAKDQFMAIGDRRLAVLAMSNRALTLRSLGETTRVVEDQKQIVRFLEQHSEPEDLPAAEVSLASTLIDLERWEEAAATLQSALNRAKAPLETKGRAWRHLAVVEINRGQFDSAKHFIDQAIEAHSQLGFTVRLLADSMTLGQWQEASGQIQSALATYRTTAAEAASEGRLDLEFEANKASATLLASLGRNNDKELERATQIAEGVRRPLAGDHLRSITGSALRELYDLKLQAQLARLDHQPDGEEHRRPRTLIEGPVATQLFLTAERSRAKSLEGFLEVQRAAIASDIDPESSLRERKLLTTAETLSKERFDLLRQEREKAIKLSPAQRSRVTEIESELRDSTVALDLIANQRLRRDPRRAAMLQARPLELSALKKLLDQRVLLSYHLLDDELLIFTVTAHSVTLYRLRGKSDIEAVQTQVATLLQSLRSPSRFLARYVAAAEGLWQRLVEPALVSLPTAPLETPLELLISPDGFLNTLPFETLLTESPSATTSWSALPFALKQNAISYLPSAGVLVHIEGQHPGSSRQRPRTAEFVAFGDSMSDQSRPDGSVSSSVSLTQIRPDFGPLPNAKREVLALAKALDAVVQPADLGSERHVFIGSEATETKARSALTSDARLLHFAVHGYVDDTLPGQSALLLAPDANHDGLLQLREVMRLNLSAELVTLSACSSAVGPEQVGEGVFSLARGFLFAGASSLLASHWEVNDRATADLMIDVYSRLAQGQGKSLALREAKLKLLALAPTAHPFYWSPFVLAGSSR